MAYTRYSIYAVARKNCLVLCIFVVDVVNLHRLAVMQPVQQGHLTWCAVVEQLHYL